MTMSVSNEATYTIQEAAERTGVSAHTLRYYERIGLLTPIHRETNSGHRRYSEDNLRLVQFLLRLRTTGMPIAQRQQTRNDLSYRSADCGRGGVQDCWHNNQITP